jgi:hypothetical protein
VHPACPVLRENLYAFIVPGPKLGDLRRDRRYALHSETFPPPRHDDGAYVTGRVEELKDPPLRERLTVQILAERGLAEPWPGFEREPLLELHVESVLVTLTGAGGDFRLATPSGGPDPPPAPASPASPAGPPLATPLRFR